MDIIINMNEMLPITKHTFTFTILLIISKYELYRNCPISVIFKLNYINIERYLLWCNLIITIYIPLYQMALKLDFLYCIA